MTSLGGLSLSAVFAIRPWICRAWASNMAGINLFYILTVMVIASGSIPKGKANVVSVPAPFYLYIFPLL